MDFYFCPLYMKAFKTTISLTFAHLCLYIERVKFFTIKVLFYDEFLTRYIVSAFAIQSKKNAYR